MSNRLLGVLILFGMFAGIFGLFQYFYILNKTNISIHSNVGKYKVEMYAKKLNREFEFFCEQRICELEDMPYFEYSYTIIKDEYQKQTGVFHVAKGIKNPVLEINLEKEVKLIGVELEPVKVSIQEKIQQIKDSKSAYKHILTPGGKSVSFILNNKRTIDISYKGENLGEIPFQEKDELEVQDIYGAPHLLLFQSEGRYFVYDTKTNKKIKLDLEVEVLYAKHFGETKDLQFVTPVGTFLIDSYSGETKYFSFFHDFVFHKKGYLGVIGPNDSSRIKNLNLEKTGNNYSVYFYDPQSKQKQLVYQTKLSIEKIIKQDQSVIIIDEKLQQYELKNYE